MGCTASVPSSYQPQNKTSKMNEISKEKEERKERKEREETKDLNPSKELEFKMIELKENLTRQRDKINEELLKIQSKDSNKKNKTEEKRSDHFRKDLEELQKETTKYLQQIDNQISKLDYLHVLQFTQKTLESLQAMKEQLLSDQKKGDKFIKNNLEPLYESEKMGLRDIFSLRSIPLPEPEAKKEFIKIDPSIEKMTIQELKDVGVVLERYQKEKNQAYFQEDLPQHIYIITMSLQFLAQKYDLNNNENWINAYKACLYLTHLYRTDINKPTQFTFEKAIENIISSIKIL